MRKYILLLSAILISSIAFCQVPSKIKLGAYFSPNYSYRTLVSESSSILTERRNEAEVGKYGYNFGLDIQACVSNKISISLGFCYQSRGFTNEQNIQFNFAEENDPLLENLSNEYVNHYIFNFLSIPINFKYQILDKGIKVSPYIGAKYNISLNSNNENITFNTETDLSETIQNNFSGIIGIDFEYSLTEQLDVYLSPFFQHDFNRISKVEHPLNEYLWDIGCKIGVSYSI